ncbi:MAG: spore coat protein CotJB [Eubacteriales bacterium]|nr:spore coat protein CotJB [Eubacteriales bacterium]
MLNCECNNAAREQLLKKIHEVSFAVQDIQLYLDTHPCDREALAFFRKMSEERNCALKKYAQMYGPLTIDTASENASDSWKWAEQPFPWE